MDPGQPRINFNGISRTNPSKPILSGFNLGGNEARPKPGEPKIMQLGLGHKHGKKSIYESSDSARTEE
jgi:hypothetical protein